MTWEYMRCLPQDVPELEREGWGHRRAAAEELR